MATLFRLRKDANDAGSGGKIMRGRRVVDASPYSRPSTSENPNRLMRFISPASRVITGAAKMISTVFFPDSPPTSSSSEDDSENDDDISSEGDDGLNQNAATSETNVYSEKNLHFNVPQNEIKPAIEGLLMQETFSRDECNKLVKIIESRVVEFPSTKVGGDAGQHPGDSQSDWQAPKSFAAYSYLGKGFDSPGSTIGGHGTDICNTALLEAKRWAEEKNRDSHSHLDKSQGRFTANPSNIIEGELGSPVLMAKSYMKSRPPWTSPTAAHSGYQAASPIGLFVSKEETPHAIAANALSSSKDLKRRDLAVDTPDGLDGSRRVRFKIAEDNVQPLKVCENLQEEKTHVEAAKRDAELSSESLPTKGFVKQSAHLNQDLEGAQIKQERSTIHPAADIALQTQDDSQSQDDYPKQKETNSSIDRVGANGFASEPSLSERVNARSGPRASNEEDLNVMTTSGGNWEGSYELLSEFSVEVPRNEETNDVIGTTINSSKQSKDQMVTETPSVSSPGMKRRSSSARVEKNVVKKVTQPPSRRGRGRGRGRGK